MPRTSVGRWQAASNAQASTAVNWRMLRNLRADPRQRRVKRVKSRWITDAVPADKATLKKRTWG
jgi:hypothetical protein